MPASTSDLLALPLYRKIALGGGLLFFIALLLPLVSVSSAWGGVSVNGWSGAWGVLAGLSVIALIGWELIRLFATVPTFAISHELVTAILAGLTGVLGIVQFIRSLTTIGSGYGVSVGPSIGAFLLLILGVGLAYAAFLAFRAGDGQAAVAEARERLRAQQAEQQRKRAEGTDSPGSTGNPSSNEPPLPPQP